MVEHAEKLSLVKVGLFCAQADMVNTTHGLSPLNQGKGESKFKVRAYE